jgi:hypothetical protein
MRVLEHMEKHLYRISRATILCYGLGIYESSQESHTAAVLRVEFPLRVLLICALFYSYSNALNTSAQLLQGFQVKEKNVTMFIRDMNPCTKV